MDVLQHAPALTAAEAADLARRLFGIDAEATPLPSERDQNFVLRTQAGDRFVLKVANSTDDRALLEAQNAALAHVARRSTLCPRVIPTTDGWEIGTCETAHGVSHFVRLLTWLPGVPLASLDEHPPELLTNLGAAIAELDCALAGFDHPAIHRDFYWDLTNGLRLVREHAPSIGDPSLRALVQDLARRVESRDGARFARLRHAAAHNDPNDYNVLVDVPPEGGNYGESPVASAFSRKITGMLDFGDMVHTYAVADLAIAVAYAILGKPDPLD